MRVWIPLRRGVLDTLCDKVCQWFVAGQWFSLGTPVSSTNKADRHDITEILLKVALNTINSILLLCYMYIDCHTVYIKDIFDVVCYVYYRIRGGGRMVVNWFSNKIMMYWNGSSTIILSSSRGATSLMRPLYLCREDGLIRQRLIYYVNIWLFYLTWKIYLHNATV